MNFKKLVLIALAALPLQSNAMFRMVRPLAQRMATQMPGQMLKAPYALRHAKPNKNYSSHLTFRPQLTKPRFTKPRWLLPATLGLSAALVAQAQNQAEQEPKKDLKPWHALEEKYRRELQEEERQLMEEFFKLTGITKQEWESGRKKYKSRFLLREKQRTKLRPKTENQLELNPVIANAIKLHLEQQGIDPQSIGIIRDDNGGFLMATNQTNIFVNESGESLNSQDMLHAAILHEIEHVKNEDFITRNYMSRLFRKKSVDLNAQTNFLGKFTEFFEKRADILPATRNISYAKAFQKNYCTAPNLRCSYITALHQEMMESMSRQAAA